ncbi:hypothetical protein EYF80_024669 [Liparis tanakae]|uniref:Uncharacterized protein n=1 Tax=Liparis tanakae TaxID=230148 RepID=A0A4Z2HHP6_9TELE|nr:hypothetical protein EYF80_024669 [Liparis tanakae]
MALFTELRGHGVTAERVVPSSLLGPARALSAVIWPDVELMADRPDTLSDSVCLGACPPELIGGGFRPPPVQGAGSDSSLGSESSSLTDMPILLGWSIGPGCVRCLLPGGSGSCNGPADAEALEMAMSEHASAAILFEERATRHPYASLRDCVGEREQLDGIKGGNEGVVAVKNEGTEDKRGEIKRHHRE